MTIEVVLIIIGLCLAVCYVVFEYQKLAVPPYQEPVKPDMAEQWVAASKADTLDNWNAKVGDKIWYKPDDGPLTSAQVAQIKETVVVPQAAWPFPHSKP